MNPPPTDPTPSQADEEMPDPIPPAPDPPPDTGTLLAAQTNQALQQISVPHQPTIIIAPNPAVGPSFEPTAHNLLMKVGDSAGSARVLPLRVVQAALKGAWGRNYYNISEIAQNLFMAHFRSARALQSVWTRQPWLLGREVLLLEWVNPDANVKPMHSYRRRSKRDDPRLSFSEGWVRNTGAHVVATHQQQFTLSGTVNPHTMERGRGGRTRSGIRGSRWNKGTTNNNAQGLINDEAGKQLQAGSSRIASEAMAPPPRAPPQP